MAEIGEEIRVLPTLPTRMFIADDQMGDALDYFENNATGNSKQQARNQLAVVWRKHIFSADKACGEAQFLLDQLPR